MSAFAVVYEWFNGPVEPGVLERVMERLQQRGPDGSDTFQTGNAAMGHWHFWTTPEEVGERQPLGLKDLPFRIVMDGRLDNRRELLEALNVNDLDGVRLSDAALVLHAYDRWGKDCFEHFIGEYALAILDEARGELVCARDALGDRSLYYAIKGTRMIVASEPWAAAGADGCAEEINDNAVVHYFAFKTCENGETLFKNVFELPPAHAMLVNASGEHHWRYWQPVPSFRLRGKSDQEYAEGFLPILEESVRCRLRSESPAGLLMSGGLDSGSVACLVSRMISPAPLETLSYVFDELSDCDERIYIEELKTRLGIHSIQIPCDDLWPYKHLQDWPRNTNQPDGNLYRMVMERTYQRARQEGLRVLLTGTYGDELYDGADDWLADLIEEGRLGEAAQEIKLHLHYTGLRRTWKSLYLRRAVTRGIKNLPVGKQLVSAVKRWRTIRTPNWLTPFSLTCLSKDKPQLDPAFELREGLLGMWIAEDCVTEAGYAGRYSIELRHPYRDRRLVEYVLGIPAHQLYRHGQYKHVLRTAMQGILPEAIRTRTRPTTLLMLLARGMERERDVLQENIQNPGAAWGKYVRADWLKQHWETPVTQETDGADAIVPWLCVSFASWYASFLRRS